MSYDGPDTTYCLLCQYQVTAAAVAAAAVYSQCRECTGQRLKIEFLGKSRPTPFMALHCSKDESSRNTARRHRQRPKALLRYASQQQQYHTKALFIRQAWLARRDQTLPTAAEYEYALRPHYWGGRHNNLIGRGRYRLLVVPRICTPGGSGRIKNATFMQRNSSITRASLDNITLVTWASAHHTSHE